MTRPRVHLCLPFFRDLDLLDIHLTEVAPLVDRIVIGEAAETFRGDPKPLHYAAARDRFREHEVKIVHVVVEKADLGDGNRAAFDRERYQRDALARGLADADPDDIVLHADEDEIVSRVALEQLHREPVARGEVRCFEQRWFQFYLNLELVTPWVRTGPRAVRLRDFRTMTSLRRVHGRGRNALSDIERGIKASIVHRRPVRRTHVAEGGWHFSWLGGAEAATRKATAIPRHSGTGEALEAETTMRAHIDARLADGRAGRGAHVVPIGDNFPERVRERPAHLEPMIAPLV